MEPRHRSKKIWLALFVTTGAVTVLVVAGAIALVQLFSYPSGGLLRGTGATTGAGGTVIRTGWSQDELIKRPGPPALDDLETDANDDGVPDGWYNASDARLVAEGGKIGPNFVRFERNEEGAPAVLSRAFGIDGKKTGAIELGIWVRLNNIRLSEREGAEPALFIDFLGKGHGADLYALSRASLGPWTHTIRGNSWTRVVKRIPVPPGTLDAIMSVGLMGAMGTLDVDGLTVKLIGVEGEDSPNLILNGDFELGDPAPACWSVEKDARRVFPGFVGEAAAELRDRGSRLQAGLAIGVAPFDQLDISVAVRASGLRGAGGAAASIFFLDELGNPLRDQEQGAYFLTWSDSFNWKVDTERVQVPRGARRAVLQFDKLDRLGVIQFDEVQVKVAPDPAAGTWTPYQAALDTDNWKEVPPSASIKAGSALDVSFLLRAPAGGDGPVTVKNGHLTFDGKQRARFFGVDLLAPTAFLPVEQAEALADRLARSGINLARIGDIDTAYGPNRSLLDDARDDTQELDPVALSRLDHLIAELKKRGIYVAIELASKRRYRKDDGVALPGLLPSGGGPAAMFDPRMGQLALQTATALLGHRNPETGLALKRDPALAWVTLYGETSLFDLKDNPAALPEPYVKKLRELSERSGGSSGARLWESLESAHLKKMAEALRKDELHAPIAGVAHWRREPDFCAAEATAGLDLVDDRLYWLPPFWSSLEGRSMLWAAPAKSFGALGNLKRRADRPYVMGMWCNQTIGAWSYPHESADYLLGVYQAMTSDWDGVVRRGVFLYPVVWGEGPPGTVGGEDIYQVAEVLNGSPHIYALWPHAASLYLRGRSSEPGEGHAAGASPPRRVEPAGRAVGKGRRRSAAGWDSAHGRLSFDTPYTQGAAGWIRGETASFPQLDFSTDNTFAVLVATSISDEPIASTKRLLVSAIGNVVPKGFRWANEWKREVAEPGHPPFLQEPVTATVVWRRKGTIRGYVLDNQGERVAPVTLEALKGGDGVTLQIDASTPAFHWELTVE